MPGEFPTVLSAGPLSYREEMAWNDFRADPGILSGRGAVLAVDLPEPLDRPSARALVDALCARHEIFRTTYGTTAGTAFRHVLPFFRHAVTEGAEAPPPRPRPGELLPDDLVRVRTEPGPAGGTRLVVALDELVTDPWSCARLRAEVADLAAGRPAPPPSARYADYAREERARELPPEQADYWRSRLAGVEAAPGPAPDGPDPGGDPAGERIVVFPDELTAAVRELSRRLRVSPFMVVTTLVTMTLAALSGTRDVTVATMSSTRPGRYADVHGNFSNVTVLRTVLTDDPTFTEALGVTRETVLGALNRPVPYLKLAELDGVRLPRPSVRVHYLPGRAHHYNATLDPKPSGASWTEDADTAEWPLDLGFVEDSARRVAIWASYDTAAYTHAAVERIVDGCCRLLASVAADPGFTCAGLGALLAA